MFGICLLFCKDITFKEGNLKAQCPTTTSPTNVVQQTELPKSCVDLFNRDILGHFSVVVFSPSQKPLEVPTTIIVINLVCFGKLGGLECSATHFFLFSFIIIIIIYLFFRASICWFIFLHPLD